MFKAQYKSRSVSEIWSTIGLYRAESSAINAALSKKNAGALLVRVIKKDGSVVYSG